MTNVMPVRPKGPQHDDSCDPPLRKRSRSEVVGDERGDEGKCHVIEEDMYEPTDGEDEPLERAKDGVPTSTPSRCPRRSRGSMEDSRRTSISENFECHPCGVSEPRVVWPDAGRIPRTLTPPIKPSTADIEKHYTTHIPPRPWCPVCVMARIKEDPHSRIDHSEEEREEDKSGLPIIAMDYQEFDKLVTEKEESRNDGDEKVKSIVVKDEATGSVLSYRITKKGPGDEWLMKRIVKDLKEWSRHHIICKTDGEPAMTAVQDALQRLREGRTSPRNPPAYNPESNGPCEKAVQDVDGQARALKIGLEARIGEKINDCSAIVGWIITHAAYLITKFSVGKDGMTPVERMTGRKWKRPMVEI